MFKNIKLLLVSTMFCTQLSLNAFAMDDDLQEINRHTTNIQNKFLTYQERIRSLEQEQENTDALLGHILNATPSVLNYLRACSTNAPQEQLQNLRTLATQDQIFPDLILSASKQIRGSTPFSIRRMVELNKDFMQLTVSNNPNLNTIVYGHGRIEGTPVRTLTNLEEGVRRTVNRITPTTQRTQTTTTETPQIPDTQTTTVQPIITQPNLQPRNLFPPTETNDLVDQIVQGVANTNINTTNNQVVNEEEEERKDAIQMVIQDNHKNDPSNLKK